jgi:hypothetical protein
MLRYIINTTYKDAPKERIAPYRVQRYLSCMFVIRNNNLQKIKLLCTRNISGGGIVLPHILYFKITKNLSLTY